MFWKKKERKNLLGMLFVLIVSCNLRLAANLDGTNGTSIYLGSNYTFTNRELAKGYVRFADGFTLPAGGRIFLRVHEPVHGNIDLNGGILVLQDDLNLGSGVTLTGTGGVIIGNNKTIYLGSDLLITTSINLALSTEDNYVNFDGRGHTIKFSKIATPTVAITMPGNSAAARGYIRFSNLRLLNVTAGLPELEVFAYPLLNGTLSYLTFDNVVISCPDLPAGAVGAHFVLRGGRNLAFPGATTFKGDVKFLGYNTVFSISGGIFIDDSAVLHLGPTTQLLCDADDFKGITFNGKNSTLLLDNADLIRRFSAGGMPWTFKKGRLMINGAANLNVSPSEEPLTLGDGISADNDFNLEILPGSVLSVGVRSLKTAAGIVVPGTGAITNNNVL